MKQDSKALRYMTTPPNMVIGIPAHTRFLHHVQPCDGNGCWLWTARCNEKGYGQFTIRAGAIIKAHRFSWKLAFGSIPEGMWVLHRCDNPPCVNPGHLFLGTRSDNTNDMLQKGRQAQGIRLKQAKLTPEKIRYIRSSKDTQKYIAARFGVSRSLISQVRIYKIWKSVE